MENLQIERAHAIIEEIRKKMDELYEIEVLAEDYEANVTVGEYKYAKELADELARRGYPVDFEADVLKVEKYWEENWEEDEL